MEVKSQLIDAQIELVLNEASLPANGKPGRFMFILDTGTLVVDDGIIWKRQGAGALGDVKQSSLKPQEFYAENGTTWVLADGRSVIGSDWADLTLKTNVPDYRGLFLRSINDDPDPTPGKEPPRSDGLQNPDGQQDIDDYGDDKTNQNGLSIASAGNHSHYTTYADNFQEVDQIFADGGPGANLYSSPSIKNTNATSSAGVHSHGWLTSDNETAPKHGNVYVYIKINR
jgi:hypothetical protein